jgi:hypothetical protein
MLRKLTVLLIALMMALGTAAPAMAHHQVGHVNNGHQLDDSLDHDKGGGNDHNKVNNGGGND